MDIGYFINAQLCQILSQSRYIQQIHIETDLMFFDLIIIYLLLKNCI